MGYRGQILSNPVAGERFVFHGTSDDTAGKLLEFDLVVEPHGRVPGGHVHPGQQESFEVLDENGEVPHGAAHRGRQAR